MPASRKPPPRLARFTSTLLTPLPPILGRTAGWALLLAYIAAGVSVVGGFINYAEVLVPSIHAIPAPLIACIPAAVSTWFAYRDVQASARLMFWIEATSVSMITIVILVLIFRNGPTLDVSQAALHAVTPPESASVSSSPSSASSASSQRPPSAPKPATHSAPSPGPLFNPPSSAVSSSLTCCYTEVFGFRQLHQDLGTSQAPFRALSTLAQIPVFGRLIEVGAFVSMFACTLACIAAAARVLLKMAHDGIAPAPLGRAHSRNETPHLAVLAVGLVVVILSIGLTARGVSGMDIYGYMGSLSVYGFITAYALVALALPIYLRRRAQLTPVYLILSIAAAVAMLLAMAGTLYPIPGPPYNILPYIYLVYLALGQVRCRLLATKILGFLCRIQF